MNLFVARFIGSPEMNLYQAAVDEAGVLVLGSQRVSLGETPPPAAAAPGQPVIVGVRPEDLALCPDGAPGALAAEVRAVERLGSQLHAFFSIDAAPPGGPAPGAGALGDGAPGGVAPGGGTPAGAGPRTAAESNAGLPGVAHNGVARLDPRAPVRPGSRITLRVDPARLYFFDPATGRAAGWPASQPAPAPALRAAGAGQGHPHPF